jgi:hypothetical protein
MGINARVGGVCVRCTSVQHFPLFELRFGFDGLEQKLLDGRCCDGVDVTLDDHGCISVYGSDRLPRVFVVVMTLPMNENLPLTSVESVVEDVVDDCSASTMCDEVAQLWGDLEVLVGIALDEVGVNLGNGAVDEVCHLVNTIVDFSSDTGGARPNVPGLVPTLLVDTACQDVVADVKVHRLFAWALNATTCLDGIDIVVNVVQRGLEARDSGLDGVRVDRNRAEIGGSRSEHNVQR